MISTAVLLLLLVNAFQAFDEFFNLLSTWGKYPPYARPPLFYLYYKALGEGQDFGNGSAGAMILTVLIVVLALVQGRLMVIGRKDDWPDLGLTSPDASFWPSRLHCAWWPATAWRASRCPTPTPCSTPSWARCSSRPRHLRAELRARLESRMGLHPAELDRPRTLPGPRDLRGGQSRPPASMSSAGGRTGSVRA